MLSPEAQLEVSREYLAIFFLAQLGGGYNGVSAATVREARRRMWGDESWTAGRGGSSSSSSSSGTSRLREDVRLVAEPKEQEQTERAMLPPDVTLSTDPRMSRVEVML